MIGSVLGDGWLSKPHLRANYLGIQHGGRQREYLLWKKERFEQEGFTVSRVYDVTRKYPAFQIRVGLGAKGIELRHQFYPNGNKTVTRHHLNKLDPEGLAVWYLDDGSVTIHKRDGLIRGREVFLCTNCFTEAENDLMAKYLEVVWGIEGKVRLVKGYPTLKFNATNAKRLFEVIGPYVPTSMASKLDLQYQEI